MTETLQPTQTRLHWYHWLVVFGSVLITVVAWKVSYTQLQQKQQLRFEFQADQLIMQVAERLSRYEDALRAGVATIQSQNNQMNAEQWRRFSQALKLEKIYPGINGIGVIYHVSPDKIEQFIADQQTSRPDFKVKPVHVNNEFWPITFVEPIAINQQAIGLDIAFESNRLNAAKRARDSGQTQITAPIILVQDDKRTPGFLQYVPLYSKPNLNTIEERQNHFLGHVYAPFIMHKLIEGTLEASNRKLLFSIVDGEEQLYNELESSHPNLDPNPMFSKSYSLDMYGRPWTLSVQTGLSFRKEANSNQPTMILVAGIIIDLMLLGIFIVLAQSNKKVLQHTSKITRQLANSESYYRHVIDAAPCGIVIINEQGTIERVNPQMEALFGYSKQELIGQNVDMLLPERYRANHPNLRKQFSQNPVSRKMGDGRKIMALTRYQYEFPAEIGLAYFVIDGSPKIIATIISVQEYARVTSELKRSNQELNHFAYIASHDLKAPLRAIVQLASWIEEDIIESASDETKNNLNLLRNRTNRLERLLDDLLIYSRAGRKLGEVREVSVSELLKNTFELLNPQQGVELEVEDGMPTFTTLVTPLETVFRNLISNAIKHSDKEQLKIRISCETLGDKYMFSVTDNGPGIPEKYHQQIFELFKTLKPRDEVEGSGMGLSIVKKILEHQELSIEVYSDGKNGSCFRFCWPIYTQEGEELV